MLPIAAVLLAAIAIFSHHGPQLSAWALRVPAWISATTSSISLAIVPPAPARRQK
jgi:hypothetical protein